MSDEITLKGIPAASGIAQGHAFILDKQDFIIPARAIMEKEVPIEVARFEEALIKTRDEIVRIQKKVGESVTEQYAKVFDAHLLVLEDRSFIDEVIERIKNEKLSAEYTFSEVLKKYVKMFSTIEDEYLRDRVSDINDVGRRILKNLMDESKLHEIDHLKEDMIIVSHDLSPSDTASMYNKNIKAFVTDVGGRTSHTAIMAKSLGIPAVIGLKDATLRIQNQDYLIVDGRKGIIIIHPTEETKSSYRGLRDQMMEFQDQFAQFKDLPSETTDGKKVSIAANIELPEEVPTLIEKGADGVGLFRSEYFYMNRVDLPTEEEQFDAYKSVAEALAPNTVTIRTLDLGGDKFISSLEIPRDMYPFLGWRAIRFCLARPDIFKTQLRAILRASAYGNIRVMYPMITGIREIRQANQILQEVKTNLRDEKVDFDENLLVGVMIEVPSAAMTADLLAKEADFFSIGTNDLIQYTLAVDRVNEQADSVYEPGHPAVLRLIKNTIDAAKKENIPVGMCGEMSGDPVMALVLLGLSLDEFSMSSVSILQIKKLIRSVSFKDAQKLAKEVLGLTTGEEVEEYSKKRLQELVPNILNAEESER